MQPFQHQKVQNRQCWTFFWLKFAIAKAGKSKQSPFTHNLVSLLVYKAIDDNTEIAIFKLTSKRSLAIAGSDFFLILIFQFNIFKWSLVVCDIC